MPSKRDSFAADLELAAAPEQIRSATIGDMGWGDYGTDRVPGYDLCPKGRVLPWATARPHLDYPYDRGFGAPECQAVYCWTDTRTLFVVQYDGSTSVCSVPRNPRDGMPEMPGG